MTSTVIVFPKVLERLWVPMMFLLSCPVGNRPYKSNGVAAFATLRALAV
jgi:hypothetical protein